MSRLSRASSSVWGGHGFLPILPSGIPVTRRHTGAHTPRQLNISLGIVCRWPAAGTSKTSNFFTADLYTFGKFKFRRKPSSVQRSTQEIRSKLRTCDRQRETARKARILFSWIGKNHIGVL